MLIAVDTGGTFTDLIVQNGDELNRFKTPTTPLDPISGIFNGLTLAAERTGCSVQELVGSTTLFYHGTTRATNAVVTDSTAKTALLVTKGHPDILLFREGGRSDVFDYRKSFPPPYVPRRLTYEVPERIDASGRVVLPLDEATVEELITTQLVHEAVEAVAVCFLWSPVNSLHETRVGELLKRFLPEVPITLSHELNPVLREYRRASSAAIDASLKPLMGNYLQDLEIRLKEVGFSGRLLVLTSSGGVLDSAVVAEAPIHSIGSGPAMAPVAGRYFADLEATVENVIVADAGGTTYDVSLVQGGRIPTTRETWIGGEFSGHMTGFSSVDVKSLGAGGGSIARVDEGGLLSVGPQSAGAEPGPACYGRGGIEPTVTDACLVLGYLDPLYFLGGTMQLDVAAAEEAIKLKVAQKLDMNLLEAAAAILAVHTERMVRAIQEITVYQGIDPSTAVLISGGGASGFNAVDIARRLEVPIVIVPSVAAVLSAAGSLLADMTREYFQTRWMTTGDFDAGDAGKVIGELRRKCETFISDLEARDNQASIEYFIEARYPHQAWDLRVPLMMNNFADPSALGALRESFHRVHEEVFGIRDASSEVEIGAWGARAVCTLAETSPAGFRATSESSGTENGRSAKRKVYFDGRFVAAPVQRLDEMPPRTRLEGPAIIEEADTVIVVNPGAVALTTDSGNLLISPEGEMGDRYSGESTTRVVGATR